MKQRLKKYTISLLTVLMIFVTFVNNAYASPIVYVLAGATGETRTGSATIATVDVKNSFAITNISGLTLTDGIQTVAVSPDQTKAYITDRFNNVVYVVDTAAKALLATIPVPNDGEIVISPDGTKGYVPGKCGDRQIHVLNLSNNSLSASIDTGLCSFFLAISPDGTKLYATDDDTIGVINTTTNTLTTTITHAGFLQDVVVSPDNSKVYAVNAGSCCPFPNGSVAVIDAATNTVSTSITVGKIPTGLALTPDGSKLYVANFDSDTVSVINTTLNTVIQTISLDVDSGPQLIKIPPDGTKAFVVKTYFATDFHTEVAVIDTLTDTLSRTLTFTNFWFGFDLAIVDRGFTQSGTNVTIRPDSQTTLTFSSVATTGDTSITPLAGAPSAFSIKNNPIYFDITSTSAFTGTVTICVNYTDERGENSFKFLHFEGGAWVDRTTSLDTVNNIICGSVSSFSPFIVAAIPTIGDLITKISEMNLQQGIENSFDAKLKSAQKALEAQRNNDVAVAENTLTAFMNEVEAQRGKILTEAQATELKDFVTILIQLL